jgi:hypothetical protein
MSVLGFNASLKKQPSEQLTIMANFYDVSQGLPVSGYALNDAEIKVFDSTGADTGSNIISGSPTLDGNNYAIFPTFKAGNDGQNYYARFKTTWTKDGQPDQVIERDLLIEVKQVGF